MAATQTAPASGRAAKLKAYLNAKCGNAENARTALTGEGFDLEVVEPPGITDRIKDAVDRGTKRIVVAGGDGTIAAAAAIVARTDTELAILPGGTLNHFAKDHGIPTDLGKAALVARDGNVIQADLGYVADCVFLNTSSIGAYVTFVRVRERFEKHVGYRIASLLAAFRMFSQLRTFGLQLEVEGVRKNYRTSLVFIGAGERELKMPALGSRIPGGKRGLHVMVVQGRRPARLFAVALAGIARGTKEASKLPDFESFVVDSCRIDLARREATIALDGELKRMNTPLEYRIERDSLRLVVSNSKDDE